MNNNVKLGYACHNETLKTTNKIGFKTMTVKYFNATELLKRIRNNFHVTYKIMQWNVENNIHLYRFSSDLIPLATHEVNNIEWWKDIEVLKYCRLIRELTQKNNIQTSFHPSQYTLLTSHDDKIIQRSYNDLKYHYKLCQLLSCKCVLLHIGGVYEDKDKAIRRFKHVFSKLPKQIQNVLFFENDDKSYNVEEVLSICESINRVFIPDFHHDKCLRSTENFSYYMDRILNTWRHTDLKPKCHLSSSKETAKVVRNHADYITIEDYNSCLEATQGKFMLMFEVKKKELAVIEIRKKGNN